MKATRHKRFARTTHIAATPPAEAAAGSAVLDSAHLGDIRGAFGTIHHGDVAPRPGLKARLKTLIAIIGPGLIVMVGDNDAGAFSTYTQAGQNYGTRFLWTLLLLVPVLYVNQEMVLRLGAVTGVGHARLILERFGKFWGAFSVIDLLLLNALTIITEFIGISLGLSHLGLPKIPGVLIAAVSVVAAASTGSFRRFERVCLVLVAGSLILIPIVIMAHPPIGQIARDFVVPGLPGGASELSTVMLLMIAIVGTTVAPWQLFFQQSYVIDKRITPRFIPYERADLSIGIGVVVTGAAAMMAFTAAAFTGTAGFGKFSNAAGVAEGLTAHVNQAAGILFAIALIDASIIGAAAVALATSYALGDVLGLKHSLHRRPSEAKGFYGVFAALLVASAVIVVIPGSPLGLLTEGVQTLAGVLLPSATVFLLLLCNDRGVLGPWVNGRATNAFTSVVIAVLVMLSIVLTASVLFPSISAAMILVILGSSTTLALAAGAYLALYRRSHPTEPVPAVNRLQRASWRMPPLALLERPSLSPARRIGIAVLRAYLLIAAALVVVRVVQLAMAG
jgi:NRAMP (natural resistance-associated macrophage protein)-like metal ion transporter